MHTEKLRQRGTSEKWLKPVKGKPRNDNIATFDIEANDWINFEMAGFYDGEKYFYFESLRALLLHAISRQYRGYRVYAHFGGRYDFQFLLKELHALMKEKVLKVRYTCVLQGPKILALKVKQNERNNVTFVDSSALLPKGLAALSEAFKVEHSKLTGTIDFEKGERVDRNNPAHRDYLRHDCLALYEVMEAFRADPKIAESGLRLTTASQAMDMWKRMLKKPIRVSPQEVQDFVRGGYVGGRCEIFKMEGHRLNVYDVNSLYPYTLSTYPMPVEYERDSSSPDDFGFHDVTVRAPELYVPILPHKIEGKLLFPVGEFRGVFFSEELKLALEHGYRIEKYHGGKKFTQSTELFKEYMDYCYRRRQDCEKGGAADLIYKLMANSLYGKFGQREKQTTLKIHEHERNFQFFNSEAMYYETGLIVTTKEQRSSHMLVHIAAATTAWARVHMARNFYLKSPEKLFYTDTDSIFTTGRLPTGGALGQLKLEKEAISGIFLQPKGYFLYRGSEILEKKIKGFPKKALKNIDLYKFKSGKISYRETKFATLKKSLISNKKFLSMVDVKKSLISAYSKRRIMKGGDTAPHVVEGGRIITLGKR